MITNGDSTKHCDRICEHSLPVAPPAVGTNLLFTGRGPSVATGKTRTAWLMDEHEADVDVSGGESGLTGTPTGVRPPPATHHLVTHVSHSRDVGTFPSGPPQCVPEAAAAAALHHHRSSTPPVPPSSLSARTAMTTVTGSAAPAARALCFGDSVPPSPATPGTSSSFPTLPMSDALDTGGLGTNAVRPSPPSPSTAPILQESYLNSCMPVEEDTDGWPTRHADTTPAALADVAPAMSTVGGEARFIGIASSRNFLIGLEGGDGDIAARGEPLPEATQLSAGATFLGREVFADPRGDLFYTTRGGSRVYLSVAHPRQRSSGGLPTTRLAAAKSVAATAVGGNQASPLVARHPPTASAAGHAFPVPLPISSRSGGGGDGGAGSFPGRATPWSPLLMPTIPSDYLSPSSASLSPPHLPRGHAAASLSTHSATRSPLMTEAGARRRDTASASASATPKLTYEEEQYRKALSHSLGLPSSRKTTTVFSYQLTPPHTRTRSGAAAAAAAASSSAGPAPPRPPLKVCNSGTTPLVSAAGITVDGECSHSENVTPSRASSASSSSVPPPLPLAGEAGAAASVDDMRTPRPFQHVGNSPTVHHHCPLPGTADSEERGRARGASTPVLSRRSTEPRGERDARDAAGMPSSLMLPPTSSAVATRAVGFDATTPWGNDSEPLGTPRNGWRDRSDGACHPRHADLQVDSTHTADDQHLLATDDAWAARTVFPAARAGTPRDRDLPSRRMVQPHAATPVPSSSSATTPTTGHAPHALATPPTSLGAWPRSTAAVAAIGAAAFSSGRARSHHHSSSSYSVLSAALCTPVRHGDNDLCPAESHASPATPVGVTRGDAGVAALHRAAGSDVLSASPLAAYVDVTALGDVYMFATPTSTSDMCPHIERQPYGGGHGNRSGTSSVLLPAATVVSSFSTRAPSRSGAGGGGGAGATPSSTLLASASAAPRPFALDRKLSVDSLETKIHQSPVHWGCLGLVVALQGGVYVLSSAVDTGKGRVREIYKARAGPAERGGGRPPFTSPAAALRVTAVISTVSLPPESGPTGLTGAAAPATPLPEERLGAPVDLSSERVFAALGLSDGSVLVQSYRLRTRASALAAERAELARASSLSSPPPPTAAVASKTGAVPSFFPLDDAPEWVAELAEERAIPASGAAPVTALHIAGHHLFTGDAAGMLSLFDLRGVFAADPSLLAPQQRLASSAPTSAAQTSPARPAWVPPQMRRLQQQQNPLRRASPSDSDAALQPATTTPVATAATPSPTSRLRSAPIHRFLPFPANTEQPPQHHLQQHRLPAFRASASDSADGHPAEASAAGDSRESALMRASHDSSTATTAAATEKGLNDGSLFQRFVAGQSKSHAQPPCWHQPVHLPLGESIFHLAVSPAQDRIAVGTTHRLLVYHVSQLLSWGGSVTPPSHCPSRPQRGGIGGSTVRRPEPLVVTQHAGRPVRAFDWLCTPPPPAVAATASVGSRAISSPFATPEVPPGSTNSRTPLPPGIPEALTAGGSAPVVVATRTPTAMRASPMLVFAGGWDGSEVCVYALTSRRVVARRKMDRPIHFLRCCPRSTDVMVSVEVGDEAALRDYRGVGEDILSLPNQGDSSNVSRSGDDRSAVESLHESFHPLQRTMPPAPPSHDAPSPPQAQLEASFPDSATFLTTDARTPSWGSLTFTPTTAAASGGLPRTPPQIARRPNAAVLSTGGTPVGRQLPPSSSESFITPLQLGASGPGAWGSAAGIAAATTATTTTTTTVTATPSTPHTPTRSPASVRHGSASVVAARLASPPQQSGRVSEGRREREDSAAGADHPGVTLAAELPYSVPPAMPLAAAPPPLTASEGTAGRGERAGERSDDGTDDDENSRPTASSIRVAGPSHLVEEEEEDAAPTTTTRVEDTRILPARLPPHPTTTTATMAGAAAIAAAARRARPAASVSPTAASLPPPAAAALAPLLHLELAIAPSEEGDDCHDSDCAASGAHEAGDVSVEEDRGAVDGSRGGSWSVTIRLRGYSDLGPNNAYVEDCVYGAFSPDCTRFVTVGPGTEGERHARVWNPFRMGDHKRKERVARAAAAAAAASPATPTTLAPRLGGGRDRSPSPSWSAGPGARCPARAPLFPFGVGGDDSVPGTDHAAVDALPWSSDDMDRQLSLERSVGAHDAESTSPSRADLPACNTLR